VFALAFCASQKVSSFHQQELGGASSNLLMAIRSNQVAVTVPECDRLIFSFF